jgi:RsiW-degrading membrane proteinase PrsW (M82 family)
MTTVTAPSFQPRLTAQPQLPAEPSPPARPPFAVRHPRVRRLSWLGVLVLGVVSYLVVLQAMMTTQNIAYFPSLLLIGAITVPVATLVFAATGGRSILPSSAGLLAFTAVVGGLVGTLAAGTIEYGTLRNLATVPMLAVGFIEEAAKLVVPLVVFVLLRRRDPREGVLIGIASGMGFATLETMGYGFQALLSAHSIAAVDMTLLVRAVLSPAGHIAWTGITVAMLWRTRTAHRRGWAFVAFLATFLAAVGLHATWDGTSSVAVRVVVAALGLVALLVVVHRAHRVPGATRRRWLRRRSGLDGRQATVLLDQAAEDLLVESLMRSADRPGMDLVEDLPGHWAVQPPSTGRTMPVTIPAVGDAR